MDILPVENEDLYDLQSIGIQTYKDHYSHIWSKKGLSEFLDYHFAIKNLQNHLNSQHIKYFIAREKNENVGFVKIILNSPMPPKHDKSGLELEKIYFLKEKVGKGYGSKMMEYIIQFAQPKEQSFIWLDVLKTNSGARSFYEKHSFYLAGEIPFSTDIKDIGMWVMRHELNTNHAKEI